MNTASSIQPHKKSAIHTDDREKYIIFLTVLLTGSTPLRQGEIFAFMDLLSSQQDRKTLSLRSVLAAGRGRHNAGRTKNRKNDERQLDIAQKFVTRHQEAPAE